MPTDLAVLGDLARAGLASAREWAGPGSRGDAFLEEVISVTRGRRRGAPTPLSALRDRGAALRLWGAGLSRMASADGPPGPAVISCLRQLEVPAVRGVAALGVTGGLAGERPVPRSEGPETDFLARLERDLAHRLPALEWVIELEDRSRVALVVADDDRPRLMPFRWLRLRVSGRGEGGVARWAGGAADLAALGRSLTGAGLPVALERRWQGSRQQAAAALPGCGTATPVVLGAGNGALLLHEMAHALEADGPGWGGAACSPLLTIWDDPARPGMRGSYRHDDEGRPARRRLLVHKGQVSGRLGDRRHAGGDAEEGHGRRASRHHAPRPRAGNLCLAAGESAVAALAGGREPVLWIHDLDAAAVDPRSGHVWLKVSDGEWLDGGRSLGPVSGLLLEGDMATLLASVDRVARQRAADSGAATCSRDGEGVPIGLLSPAFRTRGLRVLTAPESPA